MNSYVCQMIIYVNITIPIRFKKRSSDKRIFNGVNISTDLKPNFINVEEKKKKKEEHLIINLLSLFSHENNKEKGRKRGAREKKKGKRDHHLQRQPFIIYKALNLCPYTSPLPSLLLLLLLLLPSLLIPPLMGFFMDDSSICFLLYKAALFFALIRCALSLASKLRRRRRQSPSSSKLSPPMIRQSLGLTTYGDIIRRRGPGSDTCVVCMSQLGEADEVRELRNCPHVFHQECIDRWIDLDHDRPEDHDPGHNCYDVDGDGEEELCANNRCCPLCRTPLLTPSQGRDRWPEPEREPNWAVDRILYLFGDDLLY